LYAVRFAAPAAHHFGASHDGARDPPPFEASIAF